MAGKKANLGAPGFALPMGLLVLVLITGLTLAFLAFAQSKRKVINSSASVARVEQLSGTALDSIVGDLLNEIRACSLEVSSNAHYPAQTDKWYYLPRIPAVAVPQRIGDFSLPNLLKTSQKALPAWYDWKASNPVNGPIRSLSDNDTSIVSANGISVSPERWMKPGLLGQVVPDFLKKGASTFDPPDWILLTRRGPVDTAAAPSIAAMKDRNSLDYVVGRYAFAIYEVGGLIDITVTGSLLGKDDRGRRFRPGQIPLDTSPVLIPGITDPAGLIKWRDTESLASDPAHLLEPTKTFAALEPHQQTWINRQDLLRFQKDNSSWMAPEALQYLTVFSRSINRPAFTIPSSVNIRIPDPSVSNVKYGDSSTYKNPAEFFNARRSDGTLAMKNRFPLSRLALFANPAANAAEIEKYFGLTRAVDGYSWIYRGPALDTEIKTLADVADASKTPVAREPDFFEVLQAAILNGSLGQGGRGGWWPKGTSAPDYYENPGFDFWDGESSVQSRFRDNNLERHILQIGANLIDQYDADDYPTIIQRTLRGQIAPKNATKANLRNVTITADVAGIENLPYLSETMLRAYRPREENNEYANRLQLGSWWHFEFWNPHQNATQAGAGNASVTPKKLRVVMTEGKYQGNYQMHKEITDNGPTDTRFTGPPAGFINTPPVDYYSAYQNNPEGTPYQIQFNNTPDFADPKFLMPKNSTVNSTVNLRIGADAGSPGSADDQGQTYPDEGDSREGMIGIQAGTELVPEAPLWNAPPEIYDPVTYFGKVFFKGTIDNQTQPRYTSWEVQFFDANANKWRTYQRFADFGRSGDGGLGTGNAHYGDGKDSSNPMDHLSVLYESWSNYSETTSGGITTRRGVYSTFAPGRIDPRGERFGLSPWEGTTINTAITPNSKTAIGAPDNSKLFYANQLSQHSGGTRPYSIAENNYRATPNLSSPYMADHDGVVRHGDPDSSAAAAANKVDPLSVTDTARQRKRPVLLNRPFRTVGEMGYVFRDVPWKTIDFSSADSGDASLLDFFTCEDPYGTPADRTADKALLQTAVLRGKINLNTRQPAVLKALLDGSTKVLYGTEVPTVNATDRYLDGNSLTVTTLVANLLNRTKTTVTGPGVFTGTPLKTKADLVPALAALGTTAGLDLKNISYIKAEKETVARTLADLGDTQTWNLLIDIIVQGGRLNNGAANTGAGQFQVEAERRYWLHVAIDRYSGQVVDSQLEVVDE